MARTITHQPRTVTLANTKAGTTVADIKYNPTLSTTLTNGSTATYGEWEIGWATTTTTCYMDNIVDDLVTKYGS